MKAPAPALAAALTTALVLGPAPGAPALSPPALSPPALSPPALSPPALSAQPVGDGDELAAVARVETMLERYSRASVEEARQLRELTAALTAQDAAEITAVEAAEEARRARAERSTQVRALYAGGGSTGLLVAAVTATSPEDLLRRLATIDRVAANVLADGRDRTRVRAEQAATAAARQAAAGVAARRHARALERLRARTAVAAEALDDARTRAARLAAKARRAAQARAAIDAATGGAAAGRRAAAEGMTALDVSPEYLRAYRAAARTCPGLRWTLLAAVGQIESGHGRNQGPSSAGAQGPMQFMPRTFAAYAVDGDGDGTRSAWDPQDAIFTAARYLCVSGARGGSTAGVHRALLAYNHAEWYVDLVLAAEVAISRG